jgi:hypothetical protein
MKNNQLVPALNEEGFIVSLHDKDIERDLNIKNKHEIVIVVTSDALTEAKAELAYGITKTLTGLSLGYYNKHCSRSEFGLTYTLIHPSEELMCLALYNHAKRVTHTLISLAKNNTVSKQG